MGEGLRMGPLSHMYFFRLMNWQREILGYPLFYTLLGSPGVLQSNRQRLFREPETMSQTRQAVANSFKIKLICPSSCWNIYILSTRRVTGGLKKEAYCFSSQNAMPSLYTLELLKISRVTPRLPSKPTPVLPLVLDDMWVQMCFGEVYLWGAKDWKEAFVHARQAFYAKLYSLLFLLQALTT